MRVKRFRGTLARPPIRCIVKPRYFFFEDFLAAFLAPFLAAFFVAIVYSPFSIEHRILQRLRCNFSLVYVYSNFMSSEKEE
jgi:hypothetical protein